MARIYEPTAEHKAAYLKWVESRPESIRAVASRFDPWSLYLLKDSGHRVTIHGFGETGDGRVEMTVNVLKEYNFVVFERQVFGISPEELEPCDLPGKDDLVGAVLTDKDGIDRFIEVSREDVVEE